MAFTKPPFRKSPAGASKGPHGAPGAGGGKFRRGGPIKKKVCRFCADKIDIDYKNVSLIRSFITERGKILSGRITGTCSKHQRTLNSAIKRARMLALVPFAVI